MQAKSVPIQFDPAEGVGELAKDLITNYHTHLAGVRIAYLYKNKQMKKGGRIIFATAEKCSTKVKALCTASGGEAFDFAIIINHQEWVNLTDMQRKAVLDHELLHCTVEEDEKTGETKYGIVPHDIEDFSAILQRYGPEIFEDLKRFCNLAKEKLDKKELICNEVEGGVVLNVKPPKVYVINHTKEN
jgi:hypothetical protein